MGGPLFLFKTLCYNKKKQNGEQTYGRKDHPPPARKSWPGGRLLLAQREAQLEKEQAAFEAAKAQGETRKKKLLDNNDPDFVNPKEKLYDKFPLTVHQMDLIIGVLFALILLFLVLGFTHTSFFGLFGG